jgi:hypothetical protein
MYFENRNHSLEKIELIREISISLKSKSVDEYVEKIPEKQEDKKELIQDELVPIEDIEPEVLLKSLK